MEAAAEVDTVVLLSGDGDFDLLIQKIINKNNVLTEVYGVGQLTANSLKHSSTKFYEINKDLLLK